MLFPLYVESVPMVGCEMCMWVSCWFIGKEKKKRKIKALARFEPAISCLLDRRFNQLSHRASVVGGSVGMLDIVAPDWKNSCTLASFPGSSLLSGESLGTRLATRNISRFFVGIWYIHWLLSPYMHTYLSHSAVLWGCQWWRWCDCSWSGGAEDKQVEQGGRVS